VLFLAALVAAGMSYFNEEIEVYTNLFVTSRCRSPVACRWSQGCPWIVHRDPQGGIVRTRSYVPLHSVVLIIV
jgi:hypothetical protein